MMTLLCVVLTACQAIVYVCVSVSHVMFAVVATGRIDVSSDFILGSARLRY